MNELIELYKFKKIELNTILTSTIVSTNVRDNCCEWLQFLIKLKMTSLELIAQVVPKLKILKNCLMHIQYEKSKILFDKIYLELQQVEMNKFILSIVHLCNDMEKVKDVGCYGKIPKIIHFFNNLEVSYCNIVLCPQDTQPLDYLITNLEELQLAIC